MFLAGAGSGALLAKRLPTGASGGKTESRPIPALAQRQVAVHEAAHAVVSAAVRPHAAVLSAEVNVETGEDSGYGWVRHEPVLRPETKDELLADVVVDLSGMSADELINGAATDGNAHDLKNASESVAAICGMNGLCGRLAYRETLGTEEVESCLRRLKSRADRLVQANAGLIMELSETLMEIPVMGGKRTMTGDGFRAFLMDRHVTTETELGVAPENCP